MVEIIMRAGKCGHHFNPYCSSCTDALVLTNAELDGLRSKLRVATEALEQICEHCANTGYGNPIVNERIVDRCQETAMDAIAQIKEPHP